MLLNTNRHLCGYVCVKRASVRVLQEDPRCEVNMSWKGSKQSQQMLPIAVRQCPATTGTEHTEINCSNQRQRMPTIYMSTGDIATDTGGESSFTIFFQCGWGVIDWGWPVLVTTVSKKNILVVIQNIWNKQLKWRSLRCALNQFVCTGPGTLGLRETEVTATEPVEDNWVDRVKVNEKTEGREWN